MMRTSQSQFELMIDFMERVGDLSHATNGLLGRFHAIKQWQQLASALNSDATGTTKPIEKWKKVWSDLKNNTKRKASKIHQAASGDGFVRTRLTSLEQRVLKICKSQSNVVPVSSDETRTEPEDPLRSSIESKRTPSPILIVIPKDESIVDDECVVIQSTQFHKETEEAVDVSPKPLHDHAGKSSIRSRRVVRRLRSTPRRPLNGPASTRAVDAATQQFMASDEQWRNLVTELVNEHLRLREVELERQAQWQTLFSKCIDLLEKNLQK